MSGTWTAWVRNLKCEDTREKLLLAMIASLVDCRGVAMVSIESLTRCTNIEASKVRTALGSLKKRNLISFEVAPINLKNHNGAAGDSIHRVQFLDISTEETSSSEKNDKGINKIYASKEVSDSEEQKTPDLRQDSLATLIRKACENNWKGTASWALAELLAEEGQHHFASIIARRKRLCITNDPWDTITIAWEVLQSNWSAIANAKSPWALFVKIVERHCFKIDKTNTAIHHTSSRYSHESNMIGIDDFTPRVSAIVRKLIEEGMEDDIAWAGTARILEIAVQGKSKKHWFAARDARLQALGVGQKAARAWMTLLVGSQRGQAGALIENDDTYLMKQARSVVKFINQ